MSSTTSVEGPDLLLDSLPSLGPALLTNRTSVEPSIPQPSGVQTPPRKASSPSVASATPHRESSHDSENAYHLIEDIQRAIGIELTGVWVEEPNSLPFQAQLKAAVKEEYPDLDGKIGAWLQTYQGYDSATQRWNAIPADPPQESALYDPIVTIMSDILKHFQQTRKKKDGHVTKRREVRNAHRSYKLHNSADAAKGPLKSEPDISIFGTGPSACKDKHIHTKASYSQVASPWEVKAKWQFLQEQKEQVAVYARKVFIQQPNRRFVYVPLMTGEELRVIRFDRAGGYYFQWIDYHTEADLFVRLVLLLSSFNEALLGFDTSIFWRNGRRHLKITPPEIYDKESKSWRSNTAELLFELEDEPLFSRRTIRSRGTVCWSAKYNGQPYIVKDYWCAEGRDAESDFLKQLAGVSGVAQIFTFEKDRELIKTQRGFEDKEVMKPDEEGHKPVPGRSLMRVVLPRYGATLEQAESANQLLCAICDIRIATADKGILHRDISLNNLLLSPYEDSRGVIIDWDLAKKMDDLIDGKSTKDDSRTGTRLYQSIKVLKGTLRHHDNMDDLESIFYVLYIVLCGYDTSGQRLGGNLGPISDWEETLSKPLPLSAAKTGFLFPGVNPLTVKRYAGPETLVLENLLKKLMQFFQSRVSSIIEALDGDDPTPFPEYSPEQAQKEYKDFLDLICGAIEKIPEPIASTPTKRSRDYTEDGELMPPRKRPTPSNSPRPDTLSTTKFSRPSRLNVGPPANGYKDKDCSGSEDSEGESPDSPSPASSNQDAQEWTPRGGY
ncbi:hypothetical protein MSAN_00412100 [Mycena sanguinolenta]|uniref:Protein kinase domain-containing protein n=1 Tax=Mycena sanguinolenta TaxID=230812 RepID=A0A8H6ZD29_9AGAR|nr:hypothetical protein MSAN_00412100 [Mycena sanguinolenta]